MLRMLNLVMPVYVTEIICTELTMSDAEFQFEMFKWISTGKTRAHFLFHIVKYVLMLVCKTIWLGKSSLGYIFNYQFSSKRCVFNGEVYVVLAMM